MLGTKRTLSFWRPKKRLLALARALAPERPGRDRPAMPAEVLAVARVRSRIGEQAKRKGRFSEY